MRIKAFIKRRIGDTFLWRWLAGARRRVEAAARSPRWTRAFYAALPGRIVCRLSQTTGFYGPRYFDEAKDPSRESGYAAAYSDMDEFRAAAAVAQELFRPRRVLDIGCARGFQVRALEERGIEAWGIDISEHAVSTAPEEVAHRLSVCGCQHTRFPDGRFDLVMLMETLEHIPPYDIDRTIGEARRIGSRWLWATIPSIGANPYGPDGVVSGKVLERYLPLYEEAEIDLAPFGHLALDDHGRPIHGHLIVASMDWWTEAFTRHGMVRRGDLERKVNARLPYAREGAWNSYVFVKANDPRGVSPLNIDADFEWEQAGSGTWRTGAFILPPGLHRVTCALGALDGSRPANRLHRALSVRCVSAGGEAVLGLRSFTAQDLPQAAKKGALTVEVPCASEETRKARLEMRCGPAFRALPLRSGRVVFHVAAGERSRERGKAAHSAA